MKSTVVTRANLSLVSCLIALGLALSACGTSRTAEEPGAPASVKKIAGGRNQITLSADAAKRIGVKTAPATSEGGTTVIPYDAVLYDPDGATWTYTSPKPLVFVRAEITVDRVVDDGAILTKGPAPGTAVVTVGATELWGVDYGGISED